MHQSAVMDDQFCVVPFWDIPSPEADNLLSDCFIGYDDNSSSKVTSRCPNSDSKLSTGHLLGESLEDALEWTFASTAMRNDEGRFLCTLDSGNDRAIYYDGSEISSLNEFMNLYGITNLDSDDDFNMKSIDMMVATTPQAKEAVVLTPSDEILTNKSVTKLSIIPDNVSMTSLDVCTVADANMFSVRKANKARKAINSVIADNNEDDGIFNSQTTQSSTIKILDDNVQQNSSVRSSDHGQKFAMNRTCFDGISERKREQNRCAAIRYRGKRREEAKQKKQELHKLELRNIELKVEMNWLEKEVAYLKSLMKLTKSF